jgi:hypothetical protein
MLNRLGIAAEFLRNKHGPCPACGGKDRFRFDNRHGRGDWFCNHCGGDGGPGAGDGFKLLQQVRGWTFTEAVKYIAAELGLSDTDVYAPSRPTTLVPGTHIQRESLSEYGRELWASRQLIGGLALDYLEARRCRLPPPDGHLGWMPQMRHPSGYVGPALIALVTDAVTSQPISIHRTWFVPTGNKAAVDPARMLLKGCRKAGGVIRLWPDEAVMNGLGIAEGIESALAAAHGFTPMWSCIDAGNLAVFPVLRGIESLVIFLDADETGIEAAVKCAEHWNGAGKDVLLVSPSKIGTDIADEVLSA